jgi:hypothetical protein
MNCYVQAMQRATFTCFDIHLGMDSYFSFFSDGCVIRTPSPDCVGAREDACCLQFQQVLHRSPSAPPAAVLGVRIDAKLSHAA